MSRRVTAQRLRELFDYNPQTGELFTLVARNKGRTASGSLVPCNRLFHPDGRPKYAQLQVDGEKFYFHRLIWKWMTGQDAPNDVDHEDRDICNNKWANLRAATGCNNGWNRLKQSNNTSGYKGVFWNKNKSLWSAQIRANNKVYFLGRYKTPEDAYEAYKAKAHELHGEFCRYD